MSMRYLAVDSNVELAESEALAWEKRGVAMDRVDSMTDGVKKLMLNEFEYLYIGINSDVIDFMPLLNVMSWVTNTPIFIVTGNFTTQKEVAALGNGAYVFARWHLTAEDNVASVLANLSKIPESRRRTLKVIVFNDLLIAPFQHNVYMKDKRVKLSRLEFDLLLYFTANNGLVLTHDQILHKVWKEKHDDSSDEMVRSVIKRLRKKVDGMDKSHFIENIWGVGFRFSTSID